MQENISFEFNYLLWIFKELQCLSYLLFIQDGQVDGNPVWAVIYYCLRCGKIDAAVTAAKNAG